MRKLIACLLFAVIVGMLCVGIAESRSDGLVQSYACWDRCPQCFRDALHIINVLKSEVGTCPSPNYLSGIEQGSITSGIFTCSHGHKWECVIGWGPEEVWDKDLNGGVGGWRMSECVWE